MPATFAPDWVNVIVVPLACRHVPAKSAGAAPRGGRPSAARGSSAAAASAGSPGPPSAEASAASAAAVRSAACPPADVRSPVPRSGRVRLGGVRLGGTSIGGNSSGGGSSGGGSSGDGSSGDGSVSPDPHPPRRDRSCGAPDLGLRGGGARLLRARLEHHHQRHVHQLARPGDLELVRLVPRAAHGHLPPARALEVKPRLARPVGDRVACRRPGLAVPLADLHVDVRVHGRVARAAHLHRQDADGGRLEVEDQVVPASPTRTSALSLRCRGARAYTA